MPVNKNAFIRYQILDKCLSNFGRQFFLEDLKKEIEQKMFEYTGNSYTIGRTQLFKDLAFMESEIGYSIPLERLRGGSSGKRVYFRYSNSSFTIRGEKLSENEIEVIRSAISVFGRFRGLPQFEWVDELILALEDKLGLMENDGQVILFDSNEDYQGLKHISPLFDFIVKKRVVSIEYQKFGDEATREFVVHPYVLKQYNNRWFLICGRQDSKYKYTTLALDRMVSITETTFDYKVQTEDWANDHFHDVIGVTITEEQPVDVKFWVSEKRAPYIQTKPLHRSQRKLVVAEDGYTSSIRVKHNPELVSTILSYGSDLKVLSPARLIKEIQTNLRDAIKNYS